MVATQLVKIRRECHHWERRTWPRLCQQFPQGSPLEPRVTRPLGTHTVTQWQDSEARVPDLMVPPGSLHRVSVRQTVLPPEALGL